MSDTWISIQVREYAEVPFHPLKNHIQKFKAQASILERFQVKATYSRKPKQHSNFKFTEFRTEKITKKNDDRKLDSYQNRSDDN